MRGQGRHGHVCVGDVLRVRVGWAEGAGLRVLRRLRVVRVAMLQRRGRVELRGLLVVLRVALVFTSCRAVATAYSSAIGVGCAIAAASVRVRLCAISCLRLAVRVSAVLLVILRHSRSVLGWIDCVGAMLSGCRSGALGGRCGSYGIVG
jgi:hypothetical protein